MEDEKIDPKVLSAQVITDLSLLNDLMTEAEVVSEAEVLAEIRRILSKAKRLREQLG